MFNENDRNRDTTIDILKGIGIILMVIGHSGAPLHFHQIIYLFHMPLFLIASGWFFKEEYLENRKAYAIRKIKGMYFPFVKWSLLFLLLHNVLFYLGIINSSYGYKGVVGEWYNICDFIKNAFLITFLMDGYDCFILGAYWFMRCLLLGCLMLCFFSVYTSRLTKLPKSDSIVLTAGLFGIIGGGYSLIGIIIPYFPIGYRELMGAFFIGVGFYMRRSEWWKNKYLWIWALVLLLIFEQVHPTNLDYNAGFANWLVILFTGLSGFIVVFWFSHLLSPYIIVAKPLAYIGKNTFYVLTFHFLMFKPASYLKSIVNDMDWHVIGYHPVIPPDGDDLYWLVYTSSSLVLSLMAAKCVSTITIKGFLDSVNKTITR